MTNSREIHYPIFLRCCYYITDPYWKNIFEELAYGRAPIGLSIVGTQLKCKLKKKSFVYNIEETSDEDRIKSITKEVYELIALRFGLEHQLETKNSTKSIESKDWKSIKKTNIKNIHIENYVIECGKKWELSFQLQKKLLNLINSNIILKTISPKHIKFDGKKIVKIDGLSFEKGNFKFK